MRDILETVDRWSAAGKRVAVGTVVRIWGSAPRDLGAKMAVSAAGEIAGSVSGGCVEGAVAAEAEAVLETGEPRLLKYGVTHDRAWEVGLTCGGTIEVFLELHRPDALHHALREAIRIRVPCETVDSTLKSPPMRRTNSRAWYAPIPIPSAPLVESNGLKSRLRMNSSLIPLPVSSIQISARPPADVSLTTTLPSAGVASCAFRIK